MMTYQQFMPNWKKQDQCFEDEQIEVTDRDGRRLTQKGKPVVKPWPHDKPVAQISYENWLEQVVNPDSNEFYPARNKDGGPIKGTGAKHIITQIVRFRRKDRSEFLYTLGVCRGYDAFGNTVGLTCAKPEMWTKTIFNHTRVFDQRTNTTKMETSGILGTEGVYEIPFNEKNLKELFSLRESDNDIVFTVKDEVTGKAV